jgi:hypothetical protein
MSKLKNAKEKVQKVKDLLLILEKELRFFRDGSGSDRNILRRELDFADIFASIGGLLLRKPCPRP